jgi:hypothetical protein
MPSFLLLGSMSIHIRNALDARGGESSLTGREKSISTRKEHRRKPVEACARGMPCTDWQRCPCCASAQEMHQISSCMCEAVQKSRTAEKGACQDYHVAIENPFWFPPGDSILPLCPAWRSRVSPVRKATSLGHVPRRLPRDNERMVCITQAHTSVAALSSRELLAMFVTEEPSRTCAAADDSEDAARYQRHCGRSRSNTRNGHRGAHSTKLQVRPGAG